MPYEVDFLAVGDAGRSGDAIALRFGNLEPPNREQRVVVIDGGFTECGDQLVNHIRTHYQTDVVDLVISTHPDADHISGLFAVLEKLRVRELWMHRPWRYSTDIAKAYSEGRIGDATFSLALKRSLEDAVGLEALAIKRNVPIIEPFAGTSFANGAIIVLGPTEGYYAELINSFRGAPPVPEVPSTLEKIFEGVRAVIEKVAESWDIETLTDSGETSAENNSSVICLMDVDGKALLFTGDAGIPALTKAVDRLDAARFDLSKLTFIQVPHHGSARNVGPTLLNRLLGPRKAQDLALRTAFVSAAKDGAPKHPSRKVSNAFRRRGAPVHATQGIAKLSHYNTPDRPGYGPSSALPFFDEVDE